MKFEIYFHHFLLYSNTPEIIFKKLKESLSLPVGLPYSNFGGFSSGMLWVGNTYLEVLNYPKSIPAPHSNEQNSRFVGIALKTNYSAEDTLIFLKSKGIVCSEILNENIQDKDGKEITIANIILLNEYFHDFRLFFIFPLNDHFEKKENEFKSINSSVFKNFTLAVSNADKIMELFKNLNFNSSKETFFRTIKEQIVCIKKENIDSTEIISFSVKKDGEMVDILKSGLL